ncbi:MAG: HD domain-containing protein [Christensenellales bacterium]
MEDRLKQQLEFLAEVDKMKGVLRQSLLADGSRRENDAEHSWHLALMAMVLYEYAQDDVDICRVLKMALVHDLVEIYAGDTFAYDEEAGRSKQEREELAADRLFGMLPQDQGREIRSLWEEFDLMETPDARYAAAMDRIQPFLNNYLTKGHTWKLGSVTSDKVYRRMAMVKEGAPALWPFVEHIVKDSIAKGYLKA